MRKIMNVFGVLPNLARIDRAFEPMNAYPGVGNGAHCACKPVRDHDTKAEAATDCRVCKLIVFMLRLKAWGVHQTTCLITLRCHTGMLPA